MWIVAASLALLAASGWLGATSVEYLVVAATATAVAAAVVVGLAPAQRGWAIACVAALAVAVGTGAMTQQQLARLERQWAADSTGRRAEAIAELARRVTREAERLQRRALRALEAPEGRVPAFAALGAGAGAGTHGEAVVLFDADSALAWSGRPRVPLDSATAPLGVIDAPFYLALYATAARGTRRAVATVLLDAVPPADRMTRSLADDVADGASIAGFELVPLDAVASPEGEAAPVGWGTIALGGRPLLAANVELQTEGAVRLRLLERARLIVGLMLGAALSCFIVGAWRPRRELWWRAALVAVGLACVALMPLSAYSNYSRLFDPSLYYTRLGRSLTANAAALALTSALVLLTLLTAVRRQARVPDRRLAVVIVLVVAGLGPFLLRDLARGIQIPPYGVSASLWLIWEVPLFLAAVSVMLTGAAAGSAALGGSRGLPPAVAPLLAAAASLIAPVVWEAPGGWPWWYTFLWVAAIASLAVSRRTSAVIVSAATVAALGATTLVWGATMRSRVRMAEQDVAMLGSGDAYARVLAQRLAARFEGAPRATRRELLEAYATSELAAAGYPAWLSTWRAADMPAETLATAGFRVPVDSIRSLVMRTAATRDTAGADVPAAPGRAYAFTVPAESSVVAIVVAPRSQLIAADPFARLLGIEQPPQADPPYVLQLAPGGAGTGTAPSWRRQGNELHGDWLAATGTGSARVHAEVELRPLFPLVQRGALIALLNLGIVGLLWLTSVLADGVAVRWIAVRRRRWARSYRTRLSFALFAFFMVPAIAFTAWSYQQLSSDASRARELLVRETLRSVSPAGAPGDWLPRESRRLESPFLLYGQGALRAASDPLLEQLAPTGRMLAPEVAQALLVHGEVSAHRMENVGAARTLFGYRAMPLGQPVPVAVLGAPARADDLALGRRARDLGVLVLFATAVGALAALWLSGIAARQLARPIGSLRRAALAFAGGDREPELEGQPTTEFLPVFAAFRRMVSDLNASRSALEEATRRTALVLRNVASGVIAVDDQGTVTLANPRADELLGASLPPGTRLARVGPPELAERVQRFLAGAHDDEDFEMQHGDEQWRGRLTRLTRGGAVVTLNDVSEIARAERVLAWGEMARQVAHEIKNPLTPIRLGVQHLRRARSDSRVDFDRVLDQNVERILREIDRLDEIARAFSRYGQPPEQRGGAEPTDVAAVVRDLVGLETMGDEQVRWRVRGDGAPVMALARRDDLREVLLNVFENARLAKATEVACTIAAADGSVSIAVQDDGQGIPRDVLARIFEPHFSTRTSGSGLGLAVSRRLVESWGGTIELTSREGEGTRVEIRLRAAESERLSV